MKTPLPPNPVQKIMVRLLGPRDQFKRRPFHVSNLIPDSEVELNISQTRFIFTMYKGLQCLVVKKNCSNLCIRFGTWTVRRLKLSRSTVEISMWATRSSFMGRPKLDITDVIDSNVDLFVYLIEGIRFGTWNFNVWTGPNPVKCPWAKS